MTNTLFDEYCQWSPGSKIELIDGKLYIGDSLTHSRRLLSQILQGWGVEAIICLAEESLWWEALAYTFDLPWSKNSANFDVNYLKNWANQIEFNPENPPHHGDWNWSHSQLRQELKMALFSSLNRSQIQGESLGGGFVNRFHFIEQNLFKTYTGNQNYSRRIKTQGDGVDFTRGLLPFKVDLEPVYIKFEDYIYWCPEPKFEFFDGRPYIGNKEGVKGLIGLLLMTFGLSEVVKLAHPQAWVNSLLKQQETANNPLQLFSFTLIYWSRFYRYKRLI